MLIPIKDDNPLVRVKFQFVTLAILVLNIAIFLFVQGAATGELNDSQTLSYGIVPVLLFDSNYVLPANLDMIPAQATLLSYMFLHGGWMHIIANMLFLWVFADNIEDTLGHSLFLAFYLVCGALSGLLHAWIVQDSQNPLIGASGAIAGALGAYLVLFPDRKIWVLLFFGVPLKIPALVVIGFWIASQIFSFATGDYGDTEVAWVAHIAGFFVGVLLIIPIFILRRRTHSTSPDPGA